MALKPFLPQRQTTFIKCLQDNTRTVRSSAALALGKLSALSTRVDPLVSDLLTSFQASDGGVREAILTALKGVLEHAGKSVSSAVRDRVHALLKDLIHHEDDQIRISSASILGIISRLIDLFQELLTLSSSPSWSARHGSLLAFSSMLRRNPSMICLSTAFPQVLNCFKQALKNEKFPIRETSTKALGRLFLYYIKSDSLNKTFLMEILSSIVSSLHDDSSEVRRRALYALKAAAKENQLAMMKLVPTFGAALAECLKDGSTPVRLSGS